MRREIRNVVPTVAVHVTAAGVHGAAVSALGVSLGSAYMAGLAAVMLGLPVAGIALITAGRQRLGIALLLLSFLGASALGVYAILGLGVMEAAFSSPPGTWARPAFFGTTMLMALSQIKGILESIRLLGSFETKV